MRLRQRDISPSDIYRLASFARVISSGIRGVEQLVVLLGCAVRAGEREVGVMVIKAITRAPWGERPHTHPTWYEPFEEPGQIQQAVNFVLSQEGVCGICTAGDLGLLPRVLQACRDFRMLSPAEQEAVIATAGADQPLFV